MPKSSSRFLPVTNQHTKDNDFLNFQHHKLVLCAIEPFMNGIFIVFAFFNLAYFAKFVY